LALEEEARRRKEEEEEEEEEVQFRTVVKTIPRPSGWYALELGRQPTMKAAQGGKKLLPHVLIASITGQECVPLKGEEGDACLWERLQSIVLLKDVPSNMNARTLQVKLKRAVANDVKSKEKKKQLWAFNNRNANGSEVGKEGKEGKECHGEEKSNRSTTNTNNDDNNNNAAKKKQKKQTNQKNDVPFGIVRLHRAYGRPFEYNSDDSDDGIENEEAKRIKAEGRWCCGDTCFGCG
jgi:hypothetical protein